MKTQTYIEKTVENIFHCRNERQIVLAFLLRRLLNWTPKEVGKYLNLSQVHVNMLNTTRLYLLCKDDYLSAHFQASFNACYKACSDYATYMVAKEYKKSVGVTTARFESYYEYLLN